MIVWGISMGRESIPWFHCFHMFWLYFCTVEGNLHFVHLYLCQRLPPEEHENSGWHQEDLIAGDELQDVLLIGCKLVQQVSDEHQAIGAHRLQRKKERSEAENRAAISQSFTWGTEIVLNIYSDANMQAIVTLWFTIFFVRFSTWIQIWAMAGWLSRSLKHHLVGGTFSPEGCSARLSVIHF